MVDNFHKRKQAALDQRVAYAGAMQQARCPECNATIGTDGYPTSPRLLDVHDSYSLYLWVRYGQAQMEQMKGAENIFGNYDGGGFSGHL